MRVTTRVVAVAALASAGLMVSSCSSAPAPSASAITIRGCTPENPLLGSDTGEVCGGNVLDAITAKLVHYNADTAAPELDIAKSIDTKDSTNFTVTMNKGYKFSDGTEVKAKNFVDAWNWAAYGPNGQYNGYFFEPIAGYNDLQCGIGAKQAPDCTAKPPKAKTMSGLKVVDDYTFTITTSAPTSNLIMRLGYTAFIPQPDAFFADTSEGKKDFAKLPIGAGPYKMTGNTDTEMVLEKNSDYSGKNKGSVDNVTFRIYNDTSAAYNDVVANNLDVTDVIPSDQLVGDAWKTQLKDRNGVRDTGVIQVMTYSPKDANFKNIKMREAISMGFDRALITKQIFNNARVPATGWVSPVVDGYKAGACGDNCVFNAAKAKQLYTEAGGYNGTMPIWVNGDGGHKLWADAMCNQLKQNLGMKCSVEVTANFQTLRTGIAARKYLGIYRGGWQMDYPSIENFLTPIYATGAASNDGDYSNPKFDAMLKQAAAAKTAEESNILYQQAEGILAQDMPTIPLWYQQSQFGWSTKIASIKMTPFSTFDLGSVVLK